MKKTNMIKLLGTGVIMLSMVTGCGNGQSAQKYTSLVTLDVNPSIQLHLDEDDKVIEAIAVNDDAKKVLQDMELEQADANVAMNAVLGSLVKNGYLNANQNTVLLSVENDDDQARVALEDELSQYIYTTLKSYSIEGAIYSQDIDIDDDVESLMNKYSISYGKANLIEDIIDENDDAKKTYKVEDLVKLNAQDLILIYQSLDKDDTQKNANKMVGNVSTKQYITKDEALNIALKNASVSKSQIKELEIDYDMENGVLTYDIEFKYNQNEYEYEVSAAKGIVEREVEPEVKPVSKPSNTQQTTQNKVTNQNNTNYDNTNYDNTNYNSTSKPAASKPSTSSQTSKNTNYDNTNYDNTNYDDNTNYQSTNKPATSKPSTQPSSSGQSTNKNTNYDNTNYDNTNYDDHDDDDDTNYDD
ncbi:PepSY domain-containing protein [Massilimicrobiota timonensis]|uniref:PepSY domain-containing protein n=1 Tax=Massilimicrobiota timonensis TaxID=1776392 RepID=A0ABT7UG06_9FIRM|nr:PepSY domain-containing protein [Massilimicrobiota timonensis]MDM8195082.1 PepSY domain-containing protein [Massilimicrobiota timonensis]